MLSGEIAAFFQIKGAGIFEFSYANEWNWTNVKTLVKKKKKNLKWVKAYIKDLKPWNS